MSARNLSDNEIKKRNYLIEQNITHELLFVTNTGLAKNILDATHPISSLLTKEGIHHYDFQKQGEDHKIKIPCIIFSNGERIESKVSLYRPATKNGDRRFWIGRFSKYASGNEVFAVCTGNEQVAFINLSDKYPLDDYEDISSYETLEKREIELAEVDGLETKIEEADSSEIDEPSRFEVSSYGWDSDVEGLVKRLDRGDIKLPGFQRGFVWSQTEQSRFIESLILGLPVPNIFLAKDSDSKTLNIVDGQQRLKTLQRYLSGAFSISNSKRIHEDLRGRYFNKEVAKSDKSKILDDADARTLSDSILHSIVIRPDPSSDSTEYGYEYNNAVIQIFRRLNTSGKPLQPQEVRSCIFYGSFDNLLHKLNEDSNWRELFGAVHSRYKDVETILRFFALYERYDSYKAPMPSFLDKYMEDNRNPKTEQLDSKSEIFLKTTSLILNSCGPAVFKIGGTFLLSKFDAAMVGTAKMLETPGELEPQVVKNNIESLLADETYKRSTAEFINDTGNVKDRVSVAIKIMQG